MTQSATPTRPTPTHGTFAPAELQCRRLLGVPGTRLLTGP